VPGSSTEICGRDSLSLVLRVSNSNEFRVVAQMGRRSVIRQLGSTVLFLRPLSVFPRFSLIASGCSPSYAFSRRHKFHRGHQH
jgi:hypothetical protein